MAAMTRDRSRERKGEALLIPAPVGDAERIYQGALCMSLVADGYIIPGADTAAAKFRGVAVEPCDNSDGADGAKSVLLDITSPFLVAGTGFTQADVGKTVYLLDDQTVALAAGATNDVAVGLIIQFVSATQVWVLPTHASMPA